MSDEPDPTAEPPRPERDIAQELRLRPERPRVTRLSRKVLIGLGAAGSVAVLGAAIWALQVNRQPGSNKELYSTTNRPIAEKLSTLPRDYTGMPHNVPPLGPPLPGDLGRPIVAAQNAGQAVLTPAIGGAPTGAAPSSAEANPEAERRLQERLRRMQEREAARLSKLFAGTAVNEQEISAQPALAAQGGAPLRSGQEDSARASAGDADVGANGQDRKLAFVTAAGDPRTVDRLQAPASPYVVQAGTLISAALVTGVRSDLPGQITGQVTENVYDSPTGRYLLIPQGSKLIGAYDSQVTFGQSRVLLVWTRLILPNGQSVTLERQPGADAQGFSGLQDKVEEHWGALFKGALLSTLLSVGSEAGTSGQENNLLQAIRRGASDSISQTGNQVVRRQLSVQPTLTIRPGFPVRIIVNRDLVLALYSGSGG